MVQSTMLIKVTKLQPTDTVPRTSKLSDNKGIFGIMCICIIIDVYIVLYRREGNFKWITEQDAQISRLAY